MRTIGLLENGNLLQTEPGLALMTGGPGTGKTHLALNMAVQDFRTGYPVVYISMNHERFEQYLEHYIPRSKIRVLYPEQVDIDSLFGDSSSALSFADTDVYPEHFVKKPAPIFLPGTITVINLGWKRIQNNTLRNYLVGRMLQHFSLQDEPVSLFVDEFQQFRFQTQHPIIHYWLTNPAKPMTFIAPLWQDHKRTVPDTLLNIPLFLAFAQDQYSAAVSISILNNDANVFDLARLKFREVFVRYNEEPQFVKMIKEEHEVP